ncbi:MAG: proprotein convertase P-domain-containing protein [Polyangiaceae bacterium]
MKPQHILGSFLVVASVVGCSAGTGNTGGSDSQGGEAGSGNSGNSGGSGAGGAGGSDFVTTSSVTSSSTGVMACPGDCLNVVTGPCEEAFCNTDTYMCELRPLANDTPCDDGLFCTDGDICTDGECVAGPARDCGQSNSCGTAECDEGTDECKFTPVANGTACTPTDLCTDPALSICQAGQCVGAPKDCSAVAVQFPECQAASCDPSTGDCIVNPINVGVACTFGDICESNKMCTAAGICEGTPISGCTACTETEANNTAATANSGLGCASWAGGITVVGDKDCFLVDVPVAGSRITAETVDLSGTGCPTGFDSVIRLFQKQGANWVEILSDDQDGNDSCSKFLPTDTASTNLAVGSYAVCVEDWLNDGTSPPYLLLVGVLAPGCGNGIIEAGEQCDDGNVLDGDSCSSTCQLTTYDCLPGDVQVTIASTDVPKAIADLTTVNSLINVPDMGTITKVAVDLNITHTFDGDLDISLDAPNANPIILSDDNGSSGDNYTNTVFATGGADVTTGTSPFTGVFAPEGGFATILNTQSSGTWTLSIYDDAGSDTGTLNAWTLHLCITP